MSATTIKLEEKMLREIRKVKPPEKSLSAYVREAIERDIRHRRMSEAAGQYRAFLDGNKEEAVSMKEWEAAPLEKPPRRKK